MVVHKCSRCNRTWSPGEPLIYPFYGVDGVELCSECITESERKRITNAALIGRDSWKLQGNN